MKDKAFEWILLIIYLAIMCGLCYLLSVFYPGTQHSFSFIKAKIYIEVGIIFFGIASIFSVWNIFRK